MTESALRSVALLGNDPADRQWSLLEAGARLREALQRKLPDTDIGLFSPDTSWIPGWVRRGRLGRGGGTYFSRHCAYPRLLRNIHADLYHILDHGNAEMIRFLDASRTVIYCHDLIPLLFQRWKHSLIPAFSKSAFCRAMENMRRAAAIVVISDQTRQDLLKHLDYPASKIFVTSLGIDPRFKPRTPTEEICAIRKDLGLPGGFLILHVGQTLFYKNVEGLLTAFERLVRAGKPYRLVRAGAWMTAGQQHLARRLGVSDRVMDLGPQTQEALKRLYTACDCFVYPSLYEGMGLPPLEAMACGIPTVVSNGGALPETVADGASVVNVNNHQELVLAIDRIADDPVFRQQLIARGLERASQFQWEKVAERTVDVYRQILRIS